MNPDNLEITRDFRAFLANRENRTWTDDKNRTWKYYVADKTAEVDKPHPFFLNYKRDVYASLVDLYVYYLACGYLAAQFDLPEISAHTRFICDFINGRVILDKAKCDFGKRKDILAFVNLFINNTDIIICYKENRARQDKGLSNEIVISDANINVYNPRINVAVDDEMEVADDIYDDERFDNVIDEICDINSTNRNYEFRFVEDLPTFKVGEVDEKNLFIATGFAITSNAETMTNVDFPNSDLYRYRRHTVSFVLMISEAMSRSFVEVLEVMGAKTDATYVVPHSSTLRENITTALAKLKCMFLVESIFYKKEKENPIVAIAFDDIKSKPYHGDLLDIFIQVTFGAKR